MMKKLFLVLISYLTALSLFAQVGDDTRRFDLRVNAGTTFTLVPGFNNAMLVANGMIVPGYISPSNARSLSVTQASSTTQSLLGWHAEAEVLYRLPHDFNLSVGIGVNKMRFDYNSRFTYYDSNGEPVTVNMNDLSRSFGQTSLLYLSVTPLNVSKGVFANRLLLQAGPVFNWLLSHDAKNTLVIYRTPEAQANNLPDRVYFDTMGNMRNLIWGLNVGASYKIITPLYVKITAQYYVNSIYEDKADNFDVEKIRPLTIQAGFSLAPFAF